MGATLSQIFEWINSLSDEMFLSSELFTGKLSEGIPALYQYAISANQVVLPIGYTILSLFFLLELLRCSTRAEGSGGGAAMGVQMSVGVLVKLGLCKLLMDQTPTLLSAIFDMVGYLTGQIAANVSAGAVPPMPALEPGAVEIALLNTNILGALPYLLLSLIVLVLVAVVWVRSRLMVVMRFIEAYLYLIVAPVPLATLAGGEWSQVGKNFLKNFAAVAIQGTLLYLALTFYPVATHAVTLLITGAGVAASAGILGGLLLQAFFAVLLMALLAGVTQLSKTSFTMV